MSGLLQKILGGQPPAASPLPPSPPEDADFADFAGVPDPSPASILPVSAGSTVVPSVKPTVQAVPLRPFTKWYRVWERVTIRDFYQEMFVLPFVIIVLAIHWFGTRANKKKAKSWVAAHTPVLQEEFASVGFSGTRLPSLKDKEGEGLRKSLESSSLTLPPGLMKVKSHSEYITYATGRQNVAFTDIKLALYKRYNPLAWFAEEFLAWTGLQAGPVERMEATSYVFDGREADLVPAQAEGSTERFNSTYDGFVWAVVHKDSMKFLRDNRYDLSLTVTKDHPKLPDWAAIMSESAEISEAMLTNDLVKAVKETGEDMEALIISDQPIDQPKKLNDVQPKKSITLFMRFPSTSNLTSYNHQLPLFQYFLRLPDLLVSHARFRPEAMRHVRSTREEEMRKLRRTDEGERAEKRKQEGDKEKKEERDRKLKGLSAEEQKKYLDRERAAELRKGQKKRTVKG